MKCAEGVLAGLCCGDLNRLHPHNWHGALVFSTRLGSIWSSALALNEQHGVLRASDSTRYPHGPFPGMGGAGGGQRSCFHSCCMESLGQEFLSSPYRKAMSSLAPNFLMSG